VFLLRLSPFLFFFLDLSLLSGGIHPSSCSFWRSLSHPFPRAPPKKPSVVRPWSLLVTYLRSDLVLPFQGRERGPVLPRLAFLTDPVLSSCHMIDQRIPSLLSQALTRIRERVSSLTVLDLTFPTALRLPHSAFRFTSSPFLFFSSPPVVVVLISLNLERDPARVIISGD